MKIQNKIILLGTVIIPIALGVVLTRGYKHLEKTKTDSVLASQLSEVSLAKRLGDEILSPLNQRLIKLTSPSDHFQFPEKSEFSAVGLLQRDAAGAWQLIWSQKDEMSEASQWPAEYEKTLFKAVLAGEVNQDELYWVKVSDPQGKPLFLVAKLIAISPVKENSASFPEQNLNTSTSRLSLGVLRYNPLARLFDDLKGTQSSGLIVDNRGFLANATEEEKVGQLAVENSLIKEIVKQKQIMGKGQFEFGGKKILAAYTRIPSTNLTAAIISPTSVVAESLSYFKQLFLISALGAWLLCSLLAFWIAQNLKFSLRKIADFTQHLTKGEYNLQLLPKSRDEVGVLSEKVNQLRDILLAEKASAQSAVQSEAQTEKIYQSMSSGVGVTIRNPILAILGQLQLAKKKNKDDRLSETLSIIEDESKKIKDVIDRLLKFSGSEKFAISELNLKEVVQKIVDMRKERWSHLGYDVAVELNDVPSIRGNEFQITKAIEHVLANSEESLKTAETKKIEISLQKTDYVLRLMIQDSGAGMSPDVKRRVFDPFFSQKEGHVGLGLSYALGVLKDVGGEIQIHSQLERGTQVFLDIPLEVSKEEAQQNFTAKIEMASKKVSEKSLEARAAFEALLGDDGPADFNLSAFDSVEQFSLGQAISAHHFDSTSVEKLENAKDAVGLEAQPMMSTDSGKWKGASLFFEDSDEPQKTIPAVLKKTRTARKDSVKLTKISANEIFEGTPTETMNMGTGSIGSDELDQKEINELRRLTDQLENGKLGLGRTRIRSPRVRISENESPR